MIAKLILGQISHIIPVMIAKLILGQISHIIPVMIAKLTYFRSNISHNSCHDC